MYGTVQWKAQRRVISVISPNPTHTDRRSVAGDQQPERTYYAVESEYTGLFKHHAEYCNVHGTTGVDDLLLVVRQSTDMVVYSVERYSMGTV